MKLHRPIHKSALEFVLLMMILTQSWVHKLLIVFVQLCEGFDLIVR